MIITRGVNFVTVIKWSWFHLVWYTCISAVIGALYYHDILTLELPWLPVSVIGTAVAFYVGFKNNQAYDRMWEARKIWGAIVNSSRAWGSYVNTFINAKSSNETLNERELEEIKQLLTYRHIAWLYTLRKQLLKPTEWEHVSQKGRTRSLAKYYQANFGIGLIEIEEKEIEDNIKNLLPDEEYQKVYKYANPATQLVNEQAKDLERLRNRDLINEFEHMELAKVLYDLYDHQGKCERIKKFPFPRQFATMSRVFVGIFIMLLPFAMIPALLVMGESAFYISIVITGIIGWVYIMMEVIGDYSENPFQGMANDIPMLSMSRTIEIDLREMLGEKELPPSIQAKRGILM